HASPTLSPLFPYTTLFRSALENKLGDIGNFLASVTGVSWFGTLGESVTMVTGVIFVICVLTFRRGIMGELLARFGSHAGRKQERSEEHTSELQSPDHLVCR